MAIPAPSAPHPSHPFSDLRSRPASSTRGSRAKMYDSIFLAADPGSTQAPVFSSSGEAYSSEPCADCEQQCYSPISSSSKTPQCTDQCVVIACSDPKHGDALCPGLPLDPKLCDPNCEDTTDCPDCSNEFAEFLKCCTEDHRHYMDTTHSHPSANLPLETDLEAFLRASGLPTGLSTQNEPVISPDPNHYSSASDFSSSPILSPSHPSGTPFLDHDKSSFGQSPMSPHQVPSTSPDMSQGQHYRHRCQWANCNSAFSSVEELVGHVNSQHLYEMITAMNGFQSVSSSRLSSTDPTSSSIADSEGSFARNESASCRWKDCQEYHSSDMIPGPSSRSQEDMSLNNLASHLFQYHLGLPFPLPSLEVPPALPTPHQQEHAHFLRQDRHHAQQTQSSPPQQQQQQQQQLDVLPTPAPPELARRTSNEETTDAENGHDQHSHAEGHTCSGMHPCKWRGCEEVYATCQELTEHLAIAHVGSGKANYDCFWGDCDRNDGRGFSSKQKICRHLQSHTGHRPHQCNVCQQNFSEAATLQQHMRRHTQERPYACDHPGCGKSFAIAGALTIHKRVHNGHKPFKCKFCDRCFSESSNLSKHLRTHTGVRPYECTERGCEKKFARPDQLMRHLNVHRKKEAKIPKLVEELKVAT